MLASDARAASPPDRPATGRARSTPRPSVAGDRRGARIEVAAAERDETVERLAVGGVGGSVSGREPRGGGLHVALGRRDAGAAGDQAEQRLAVERVGLLREVADGERGGLAVDAAGVGRVDARDQAQQRRLADAVGPTTPTRAPAGRASETSERMVAAPW